MSVSGGLHKATVQYSTVQYSTVQASAEALHNTAGQNIALLPKTIPTLSDWCGGGLGRLRLTGSSLQNTQCRVWFSLSPQDIPPSGWTRRHTPHALSFKAALVLALVSAWPADELVTLSVSPSCLFTLLIPNPAFLPKEMDCSFGASPASTVGQQVTVL